MHHPAHQHLQVRARLLYSDAAVLRLLAMCHRRQWALLDLDVRLVGNCLRVDMGLRASQLSAERVAHSLGNLVDVLEVSTTSHPSTRAELVR